MTQDRRLADFGHRYQVSNVSTDYEMRYESIPMYQYGGMDVQHHITTERVRIVTMKLPLDKLDELMDDLEMKQDEVNLRRCVPAINDLYQKYRMMLELYK